MGVLYMVSSDFKVEVHPDMKLILIEAENEKNRSVKV